MIGAIKTAFHYLLLAWAKKNESHGPGSSLLSLSVSSSVMFSFLSHIMVRRKKK